VVGLITPWNFPIAIASWKLGPALAAGNTVVLKPAELTPLTAVELERIALDAGLPDGVLNVVVGPGRSVGERIVEHPDVAKVAFTGSTAVGRRIQALAAETIKRVTLELGGKSANVVFADADLERAAASAPMAVFGNAGQDCCARSRILVERSALDRFMDALEEAVEAVECAVVGVYLDERTRVRSEQHLEPDVLVAARGAHPGADGVHRDLVHVGEPDGVVPEDRRPLDQGRVLLGRRTGAGQEHEEPPEPALGGTDRDVMHAVHVVDGGIGRASSDEPHQGRGQGSGRGCAEESAPDGAPRKEDEREA